MMHDDLLTHNDAFRTKEALAGLANASVTVIRAFGQFDTETQRYKIARSRQ